MLRNRVRYLATQSQVPIVFDRNVKKLQKQRAAVDPFSRDVDYLKDEVADRMVDRLLDIKRNFPLMLDLGSGAGHIAKYLDDGMVDKLIMTDSTDIDKKFQVKVERKVGDEELLDFPENHFDGVMSNMSLHWVNDLPGTLSQVNRILKPDGMFMGAMVGGDTLFELRSSLQLAQMEREGGISPHVSPMVDIKDLSSLLQRAGFVLTTVDYDEIVINFPSMFELLSDLRSMGENNAIVDRKKTLSRETLVAASAIYRELYGDKEKKESIPATIQVMYMIGWKPDPSQVKPKARGSATASLKDALEGKHLPSSEKKDE